MAQCNMKYRLKVKPFKYEMDKRREHWKKINDPIEKQHMIPLEAQGSIVEGLVSKSCYVNLSQMLDLPSIEVSDVGSESSVDTVIPYIPSQLDSPAQSRKRSTALEVMLDRTARTTIASASESLHSSQYESESTSATNKETGKTNTERSSALGNGNSEEQSEEYEALSDYVEVEKKIDHSRAHNHDLMMKHKAILKFLGLSEAEAATWRVKEAKDVSDLTEMTLEEQGDFLINKIAVDFCDWMRQLGGDEKSFISEEILKELFQIGMDNPASRAICVKMREKRVLYYKLAEFLKVPQKSFHEVLSLHLRWDAEEEKKPSKQVAFGKGLPKDLRFKTPQNKTAETWLEWNKINTDQLTFADVYSSIKDLRSTKEYCKWLTNHPEHKKPQYLVDQGMFDTHIKTEPRRMSVYSGRRTVTSLSTKSGF